MTKLIAYCGIDCAECQSYKATAADDHETLERIARERQEKYHRSDLTVETVICDGCSAGGRLSAYCSVCAIRSCAKSRSLKNCGKCEDYEGCEKLLIVHKHAQKAKETLDAERT